MALIKCKNCGTDITDNATKCYKCGATNEYAIKQKQENKNESNIFLILLGIIIFAIGIYFMTNGTQKTLNNNTTTNNNENNTITLWEDKDFLNSPDTITVY